MAKRYPGGFITATFKPLDPHGDYYNLYLWGNGGYGRLGNNATGYKYSPVQVGSSTTSWISPAGGDRNSAAIKSTNTTSGSLWTWGNNADNGQLGYGPYTDAKSSPVQVGALTNWSKVEIGQYHMIAVKSDGTLWTWGSHIYGEMGDGTVASNAGRSSPVQIGADTNWSYVNAGTSISFAIKTTGTLYAFGYNNFGQLGLNMRVNQTSPNQVGTDSNWLMAVSGYNNSSAAIRTTGTMWTWGRDLAGEGAQSTTTVRRSSPTQVGALTNWKFVDMGKTGAACGAVKTDGTLWTWGRGGEGALGTNSIIYRSSPVQVGTLSSWSKVASSGTWMAAVKTDGTLWAWGTGQQLGTGDLVFRSSPVQVGALTNWSNVSISVNHTLAILGVPF